MKPMTPRLATLWDWGGYLSRWVPGKTLCHRGLYPVEKGLDVAKIHLSDTRLSIVVFEE